MRPSKQKEEEEEVIYCLDETQEERRSYEGWDGGGRGAAVRASLGPVRGGVMKGGMVAVEEQQLEQAWVQLEEVVERHGRHETVSS